MKDSRLAAAIPRTDDDDGSASQLSKRMRGRRSVKRVELIGHDFVWRILVGSEKQECIAGAMERFRALDIPHEMRAYGDLEDEITWQILWRTMRDPDHVGSDLDPYPRPYAATIAETRDYLTPDDRDILISSYLDYEEEINPIPSGLDDAFHTQIEHILKKNESTTQLVTDLMNYGSRLLASYLVTTASQQSSSPSGKSISSPTNTTKSTSGTLETPIKNPASNE